MIFIINLILLIDFNDATSTTPLRSKRGKYPALELYDHANIENRDNEMMINNEAMKSLETMYPSSFLSSSSGKLNLHKFIRFALHTKDLSIDDINQELIHFPQLINQPLEKLIAPRSAALEYFNNNNINDLNHALVNLMNGDDEVFCINYNLDKDDYIKFKKSFLNGGLSAARSDDLLLIQLLLKYGWNSNEVDRRNRNALSYACSFGNYNIVKELINHSEEEVNTVDNDNNSILHYACEGGSLNIVKLLLDYNLHIQVLNNELTTPSHWSAGCNSLDILKFIYKKYGKSEFEKTNIFKCNCIHYATSGGAVDALEFFFKIGMDLRIENDHGHDGLTKAVAFQKVNIIKWLKNHFYTETQFQDEINRLRPWDDDNISLYKIAEIVGASEELKNLIK